MNPRAFVIAEAGVNHNGSLDLALQLVDAAKNAGADAVKFQTFTAAGVVVKGASKAEYQKKSTGADESQYGMLEKLELPHDAHKTLAARCRERGILFMSTPFDLASLEFLVELGVPRLKIASGEITNKRLLERAAASGLPLIVSSGMSTLGEIEAALGVLAKGYLGRNGVDLTPEAAYLDARGRAALESNVTLLHCTTEYPAPYDDVNLRAMETMQRAFGLPVGYSDHTLDIYVPLAAIALGATLIEKHFTLDRKLPGPDHAASLEPAKLAEMITGIRAVEAALGEPRKVPGLSELKNRPIARRSLVAATRVAKGERFTAQNLTAKRPGIGISPMLIDEWIGRAATRDYEPDDLIED